MLLDMRVSICGGTHKKDCSILGYMRGGPLLAQRMLGFAWSTEFNGLVAREECAKVLLWAY